LDDPFPDPEGLEIPDKSPVPTRGKRKTERNELKQKRNEHACLFFHLI